jgi:hypothetical protein
VSKRDLKKYLKNLDKDELTKVILDTYSNNKDAKEYLDYLVEPNEKELLLKAKKIIREEYFPEKHFPQKPRLSVAKRAIADFKRFDPPKELIAELLLFLVEQCCEFADSYGISDDEPFYDSVENNYSRALDFINKNDLSDKFKSRAKKLTELSPDYGFNEAMCEIFLGFYIESDE